MTLEQIKLLIKEGEGLTVEFKERYTPRIDQDIVAFSNSKGGVILLGITDEGKITGEKLIGKLKAEILNIARNCHDSINVAVEQIKDIIVVDVSEGNNKPYQCSSGYFKRFDVITQKLTPQEIKIMYRENLGGSFENIFNNKFTINDISFNKIKTFLKESDIKLSVNKNNVLNFLQSLNLAEGRKIKNATVLMFAKNVGKYFMHSQIALLLFKDHNKVEFLDRKHVRDDLFIQFKEAMVFIEKHLSRRSKIVGVNRVDTYEVPIEAVREAVANAIIHRDYSMTGTDIMIEIYPDTLEISNPGGLISGIKKEELGKKSVRRNELIADLFFRMDKIEKVGTGINRIRDAVKKVGLKEPVFESDSFFRTVFYFPEPLPVYDKLTISKSTKKEWSEKVVSKGGMKKWYGKSGMEITNRQMQVLDVIKKSPMISIKDMANNLKINVSAVQKHVEKLKLKGLLKRVGPDKGGHWKVIENLFFTICE